MEIIVKALSRRNLIKGLLAWPFVKLMERFFSPWQAESVAAMAPIKVARVSDLRQPWSSAKFIYTTNLKAKDVYGKETVIRQDIPGVIIRLPDDLAAKKGGGPKDRFYVVNLHCTHERCVTAYLADKDEIKAVSNWDAKNPMAYCPCHRSVFDLAAQGKPVMGPAKEPLWKFDFDIKGDDLIVTGLDPKASMWEPGRAGGLGSEYPVRPNEPGL